MSVDLRPAAALMTGPRLGALQPCRLSASRSLISRMCVEGWTIRRGRFDLDGDGSGTVVYEIDAAGTPLSFVAFSSRPSMVNRTPRIIGSSWDLLGALMEGGADDDRVEQTAREMPKLYAGRAAPGTLVWCRANRSLRAFDVTVDALAEGRQPAADELFDIGYLMRNTGLDGNGTFGTRSFLDYEPGHPLRTPYHAQMLTAYLMREFSFDLVDHLAAHRSPAAAALDPDYRRYLGLGNGSGLGLVLFALNHPVMVASWIRIREQALAMARALEPDDAALARLAGLLDRTIRYRAEDPQRYGVFPQSSEVARELAGVLERLRTVEGPSGSLGDLVDVWSTGLSAEAAETLNALLLELVPDRADALLEDLVVDEVLTYDPRMSVAELRELVDRQYAWALEYDLAPAHARERIWYKSRAAEEPRSGPESEAPPSFDLGVDVVGDIRRLRVVLDELADDVRLGELVARWPEHRAVVQRLHTLRDEPYGFPRIDVRDNDFVPAWIIRLGNGAFYGLDRTKDFLNRNLRGLVFHGAPTRGELGSADPDGWWHPARPAGPTAAA